MTDSDRAEYWQARLKTLQEQIERLQGALAEKELEVSKLQKKCDILEEENVCLRGG